MVRKYWPDYINLYEISQESWNRIEFVIQYIIGAVVATLILYRWKAAKCQAKHFSSITGLIIIKIGEEYLDTIIGRYVWSKSGRDKDRLFIIIDLYDDQHVLLADGELRPAGNPKKKKLKHLNITNKIAEEINMIVTMKKKLLDADLQRAINSYNE